MSSMQASQAPQAFGLLTDGLTQFVCGRACVLSEGAATGARVNLVNGGRGVKATVPSARRSVGQRQEAGQFSRYDVETVHPIRTDAAAGIPRLRRAAIGGRTASPVRAPAALSLNQKGISESPPISSVRPTGMLALAVAVFGIVPASAQELEVICRQLQGGAGFAVAAGEGRGLDLAFDQDQLALADVLRGDLGHLAPAGDLPPGRFLLGLAAGVGPAAGGRERSR